MPRDLGPKFYRNKIFVVKNAFVTIMQQIILLVAVFQHFVWVFDFGQNFCPFLKTQMEF